MRRRRGRPAGVLPREGALPREGGLPGGAGVAWDGPVETGGQASGRTTGRSVGAGRGSTSGAGRAGSGLERGASGADFCGELGGVGVEGAGAGGMALAAGEGVVVEGETRSDAAMGRSTGLGSLRKAQGVMCDAR